jgi:PKD repeat protein
MMRNFTTLVLLLLTISLFAQKAEFQGQPIKTLGDPALDAQFYKWNTYQFDALAFDSFVKKAGQSMEFNLKFGDQDWNIHLEQRDLRGPNYVVSVLTDKGVQQGQSIGNVTYRGQLEGKTGGAVSLTIYQDFLYGFVENDGELFFIEPQWYFTPDAPKDRFVVYKASDVKPKAGAKCGFDEMMQHTPHADELEEPVNTAAPAKMGCKLIEYSIASDLSMYNKYGSVFGVEFHNIGVMNNVQTNYDTEFNDELQFSIVEQFVVSPPATDPWSNSTNANVVLNSFTSWGPSGFSQIHDIGGLWTNRNFDGGTIGIAWLGAVCTSSRYHCLQDFSSNANLLRVLTAHEIGHNFNASHDPSGSPTIMAPAVNNTNAWSTQSLNQINAYYPGRPCLSNCATALPPVAGFSVNPSTGCAPMVVNYIDQSQNNPTSWNWTFPGGSPASSTQQNPVVTYSTPGTYNATLTVTNGVGSNTHTQTNAVTVGTNPSASFAYAIVGLTVVFTNLSTNATSYLWDFGDGQTSTQFNPVHTYAVDGFYTVTLNAINQCGSVPVTQVIPVFIPPVAGFSASPTSGCVGMIVTFTNQSSPNTTNWSWSFPGGTPSTSTQQNPVVTYNSPGTYAVTLTVSNPAGSNTMTQSGYITVNTIPTPSFTSAVNGNTVTFTNNSTNATSYSWNFGDGQTSTQTNPTHTYANNGNYTVTLTATNNCGPAAISQTVNIVLPPTAGFSANNTSGCAPLTVTFNNTSNFATSYAWSFPGGTPSTSTNANPTVVYSTAGAYNVTLIVTNSAGSDTLTLTNYISVAPQPVPGFTSSINGLTATFTNTSTNATSYLWDFGDNQTATLPNPVHTYAADGTYTVTLSATNGCGTVTTTQTVTIVTPPTAGFSANNTAGCAPLTVQFSNQSSANATSWNWQFPGGTPSSSTAQNPTVTYNAVGTYTVTLTVSNSAGQNTSTQTNYITVTTTPVAGFTFTTTNATATFTNTSNNATSYSWNFGDGQTSTLANPTHTYNEDGTYTVTLSATNACGTVTTTQTVTIVTPPSAGFSSNVTTGCAPLTVQFSNESSENATSFAWQFPGGTPATSTAENPTVTYSTAGSYTVTLTVTNSAGTNTSTQTNYIVVTTVPVAGFTASTNVFVANFTNTTVNGTSYSWNFGDGGTSTGTNPSHTYPADGTYTVTLTATNACGTHTFTQDVVITSLPQANFTVASTTGCAPFTVQFSDQSSSNTTAWNWSFPGGTPSSSTAENPTVTYNAVGTYTVTLTASNALGENTVVKTNYITVITTPTAGFTSSTNLLTATFNNTSAGATSYLWNFGDSQTSTSASPSHTYAEDGVYTVTLTATNACGSVASTQTITVVSMPTAGFSASATAGCAPFTVQFTNESSENATTFAWQFPGGTPATSPAENPSVTYSAAGTYSVTLTVSNAAGQNVVTQTNLITVNAVPAAGFTGSVSGLNIDFTNTTTNATSYSWNFGDGETSTSANPSHTYAEDGVYVVTLTATNGCGSVTSTQTFTIVTPPTAGFSAVETSGCEPFTVQFKNESSENAATFAWTFPGGTPATSTEENPVVVYSAAGTYSVTLVVSNAAGNDTYELTDYISVKPMPTAGFTSVVNGSAVVFTNTSTNAGSYVWNFGDGESSTEENPQHAYVQDGIYTVTLTATNDCGSVTTTKTVVVATMGPIAAFTAESTNGCAPLTVVFENLSSENAESFQWSFPGGEPSTSTEENPVVVYNTPGVYDVTLTAINGQGNNSSTQPGLVVVNGVPSTSFTQTVNGGTVTFNNTSTGATTYKWDFGDGENSTELNPVHTYSQSGEYMVTLTSENECGFSSATITIQVVVTGVGEIPGISEFNVYPNPNSGRFTLTLKGEPQTSLELSFTNVLGQRLLNERVNFNTGQISREFSFGQLPAGMYIFQVKSGDKAIFKKLIIE